MAVQANKNHFSALIITAALLALAAAFWFLQTYGQARPDIAPLTASAQVFSAAVDAYAGFFHLQQYGNEGQIESPVHVSERTLLT